MSFWKTLSHNNQMIVKSILLSLESPFSIKRYYSKLDTHSMLNFSSANVSTTNIPRMPATALTHDEQLMKDAVSKLDKEKIAPLVSKMDLEGKPDPDVVKALYSNGLMAVETPSEYGGAGSTFGAVMIIIEELAKIDAGISAICDLQNLMNSLVYQLGTSEQKNKFLPLLATNMGASFCLSEPQAGSDAFALKTTALRDGDDYLLNGSKMWISSADLSEIFIVFANTDPSQGYKGITSFIVEKGMAGFSLGKNIDKLGIRSITLCPLHFKNVRVPVSNVLGGVVAQGCFDAAVPYTIDRKQFGKRIFDFQSMNHQIARVATNIECARLLVYNACRLKEANLPFTKEASMAKYYAAEVATETTSKCIEWMGGAGFTKDYPIENFYRDCIIGTIYEGSTNIQLNTIAKFIQKQFNK